MTLPTPLDQLLSKQVMVNGALQTQRGAINIVAAGATATDVPPNPAVPNDLGSTAITIPIGTTVTPNFFAALATTNPGSARQAFYIDGYSAIADGGEGWWAWNSTSTLTPDHGTIVQVTGITTGRWIRQAPFDKLNVCWYGAKGDGVTDDSAAIQNATLAAGFGGTVFFPRLPPYRNTTQVYLITSQQVIDLATNFNVTFLGDGPSIDDAQVTLRASFSVSTGNTGSLTAINTSSGGFLNFGIITASLPSGFSASVAPGDWIVLSGATSTDANGVCIANNPFQILTVNLAAKTLTFFGFAPTLGAVDAHPVIVPDANNGHLTWSIYKPMFQVSSRGCLFKNITFDGGNTAVLFNFTQPTSNAATHLQFESCSFKNAPIGFTTGALGPTGYGPSGNVFPTNQNCDLGIFRKCSFNCTTFNFMIPSLSGQQKNFIFDGCDFTGTLQTTNYGFMMWSGSVNTTGISVTTLGSAFMFVYNPSDIMTFHNTQIENTPRLIISGPSGAYGAQHTYLFPCLFDGIRWDTVPNGTLVGAYPSDGFIVQWALLGGLEIRGLEFSVGIGGFSPPPTININAATSVGGANPKIGSVLACIVMGSIFTSDLDETSGIDHVEIVSNRDAVHPITWWSCGNSVQASPSSAINGQNYGVYEGAHTLLATPAGSASGIPGHQLTNLCHPVRGITLTNGINADIQTYFASAIELTGGGASAVVAGANEGKRDQLATWTNLTGSNISFHHEDSTNETTATRRFHSPTGANVTVTTSLVARYSTTLSRWLILFFQ